MMTGNIARIWRVSRTWEAQAMAELDLTIPVYGRGFPSGAADPRRPELPYEVPPEGPQVSPGDQGGKRSRGVQFKRALTSEEEAELSQRFGISLDAYVPDFTYLVLIDDQTLAELRQNPIFNATFLYGAHFKMEEGIGAREYVSEQRRQIAPDLLLWAVLFRTADVDAVVARLRDLGAQEPVVLDDREEDGNITVEFLLPAGRPIAPIAMLDGVRWLDEVPEARDNMPLLAGLVQSGIPDDTPYWNHELRGQDQVIGVLDSGRLDRLHCWFRADGNNDPGPGHRKIVSYESASINGNHRHCTFVGGIVAGDDIGNSGGHPHRGVAWAARIAYANREDFGAPHYKRLLNYLDIAHDNGARIHSNSWHDVAARYTERASQFDRFTWRNEDCLVVASSGNSSEGVKRGPPGTAKNSLCVSAGNVGDGVSCFGDGIPGPTSDGRRKPDLLAPGCRSISARTATECGTLPDVEVGANGIPACDGEARCASSFATPVVAAAAAIVRQYFLGGWYPDGDKDSPNADPFADPTGALLKAVLLNAANKTTACPDFPSHSEGWGLLQLDPILRLEGGLWKIWVRDVPHAQGIHIFGDQEQCHTVHVDSSGMPLKVTLVWTDYPGNPWAQDGKVLVNNLDLEVTAPGATDPFKGNVFSGNQSILGGNADHLNTVEMVYVPVPTSGDWDICVKGTRIAKGRPGQGYALVVSGDVSEPAV
jgi:hypothetical protein